MSEVLEQDSQLDGSDSKQMQPINQQPAINSQQAAAILMLLFSEEQAAEILSRLEPDEVGMLSETMYSVADIGSEHIHHVLDMFIKSAANRTTIGYQADQQISSMLKMALGEKNAETMIKRVAPKKKSTNQALESLKWMDADEIAEMIRSEHPQICAVILSFIKSEVAANVLKILPIESHEEIVYRLATLGPVSQQALETVELLLSNFSMERKGAAAQSGGTSDAAAILNNMNKSDGQKLIKAINKRNKDIARKIEDEMFVFIDLMQLSAKDLGTLIRNVGSEILVPALKGAEQEMRDKIFASMSSRAAQSIQDEMEESGPMPLSEVIEAQKAIIAIARKLADSGEIIIGGQGEEYV